MRTKPQLSLAAPHVNTDPVVDGEIDGHRIFRPAGSRRTIGHLLHFHGLGALSTQEIDFLHRLASGKFQGEPVAVVAPMAQSLAPRDLSFNNLQSFYALARFVRQQPREVRNLLLTNLISDRSFFVRLWRTMQTINNPPWWYPFVFEPAYDARESSPDDFVFAKSGWTASCWQALHFSKSYALRPDFDATIKLMFRTVEEIAPRTDAVLAQMGAVRGHVCASGFSQGVGPAIIFSAILRPRTFCHLVAICASHVKTSNTPAMNDPDLKIDVILPRGDPVLQTTGFRDPKIRRDLQADFRARARIWEPPGGHSVEGHVAHIAGMQIVNSLRNSHGKYGIFRAARDARESLGKGRGKLILQSGIPSSSSRMPTASIAAPNHDRRDITEHDVLFDAIVDGGMAATAANASIVLAASVIAILYNTVLLLGGCIPKVRASRRSFGPSSNERHLEEDA